VETYSADSGFPDGTTTFLLTGPAGPIEAVTTTPVDHAALATAVICHPHPPEGGTLHNKVVHTMARALGELGLRTLRFNFRGVGRSAGAYTGGVGETEDTLAVLDWVRRQRPHDQIWLAGFSFGGFVALRASARFPVARLTLVAPAIHRFAQIGAPPAPTVPVLVLLGDADEIIPPDEILTWCAALTPAPDVRVFPGVGHFFHGRLNELRAALKEALAPHVP
jgi:uncharacterized protein